MVERPASGYYLTEKYISGAGRYVMGRLKDNIKAGISANKTLVGLRGEGFSIRTQDFYHDFRKVQSYAHARDYVKEEKGESWFNNVVIPIREDTGLGWKAIGKLINQWKAETEELMADQELSGYIDKYMRTVSP